MREQIAVVAVETANVLDCGPSEGQAALCADARHRAWRGAWLKRPWQWRVPLPRLCGRRHIS